MPRKRDERRGKMASEQTIGEKNKAGAGDFIAETRREIAKVTWPTRREIVQTTVIIVLLALIAGVFFLAVDWALGNLVSRLLGMNS
jgi:preprotein translocase subunit SecE